MKTNKQQGFSLIELMIVVAIIGILAAIAYPSYQENVASTHRANAQSELMGLSSALERWYTQNNHYSNA
ncbi:type IV pilin protein, partial [Oleiphilus sp. HI0066]|uniref:type IV pilin protein n=3 Tax=Oleiphilus TaxID=141450 RepID=UPI000B186343